MKKSSASFLGRGLFLCIALTGLFISCENFMEDSNFTSMLQSDIAYANSEVNEIRLECEEGAGTFSSSSVLYKKATDTFDVEFKKNTDWNFTGWHAYTKDSDGKLTELSSEYILMEDELQIKENIYRTSVTLIKSSKNIIIKAECFLTPSIVSHTPQSPIELQYANTPVIINFNTRIKKDSLYFSKDSIDIASDGTVISSCFYEPELDDTGKVLTLTPITEKLMQFMNQSEWININFSFGKNIVSDFEDSEVPLSEKNASFTVRYKNESETEPPEAINFFATAKQISLNGQGAYSPEINDSDKMYLSDVFTMDLFTINEKEAAEKICHNKTGLSVYLYGNFHDRLSKISRITVTERHTHYRTGILSHFDPITTTYEKTTQDIIFNENDVSFCIPYRIISGDGALVLTVSVYDSSGNFCSKEFTVISYSTLSDFTVYNAQIITSDDSFDFNMQNYLENSKTLIISENDIYLSSNDSSEQEKIEKLCTELFNVFTNKPVTCQEDYEITAEYKDRTGRYITQTFDFDDTNKEYSLTLDVDTLDDLTVNITATDSIGIMAYKTITFPAKDRLFYIQETEDSIIINPAPQDSAKPTLLVLWEENENGTQITKCKALTEENKTFPKGHYSIIGGLCKNQYSSLMTIYGDICELNYSEEEEEEEEETLTPVSVTNISLTKHSYDKRYVVASIEFSPDEWEKFDSIYIPYDSWNGQRFLYLNKGQTSFTLNLNVDELYTEDAHIKIYGLKNGILTEPYGKYVCTIQKLTDPSFDTMPPKIEVKVRDYETFILSATDTGSEVKSVLLIHPDGKEIPINPGPSGFENIELSPVFLRENVTREMWYTDTEYCFLYFKLEDTQGNISQPNERIDICNFQYIMDERHRFGINKESSNQYKIFPIYGIEENYSNTVSSFNKDSKEWTEATASGEGSEKIYNITDNTYAKIKRIYIRRKDNGEIIEYEQGNSQYSYAGELRNSGDYDYIQPSAYNANIILVTSDAPVLMQTIATECSLSTASKWDEEEWDFHYIIDEKQIDFTSQNPVAKKYTIPVNSENLKPGMCYVVIARFANGTSTKSNVMVK